MTPFQITVLKIPLLHYRIRAGRKYRGFYTPYPLVVNDTYRTHVHTLPSDTHVHTLPSFQIHCKTYDDDDVRLGPLANTDV